eukprot:TRINITY_DN4946_c0_g1_i3.p7 TRINITY_DN4946_c0_g1~~TRINITY_DN4946_c0_g1_i3.p7  ORF type:complete len:103 (-),score=13.67 TRINITY_DN4946_c0_g1_i3:150-458(-)
MVSSGQTLGVKAQRFRGHTSPYRNVKEKKNIHGEEDNNPGTLTMQSERFYQALKGNGVTTRLVLLPHEKHAYRAKESLLHCLYEMNEWLDKYCKGVVNNASN